MKFKRNNDNIASKIHDEIVMVNIEKGNYYGLNAVGSDIWDFIESPRTEVEICEMLLEKYDIDTKTCRAEVKEFLKKLLDQNLIETFNA